jgi:hypothetical protein
MLAASISGLFDLANPSIELCRRRLDHASGTEIISIGSMSGHCAVLDRIRGMLTDFLITVHFQFLLLVPALPAIMMIECSRAIGARRPNAPTGDTFQTKASELSITRTTFGQERVCHGRWRG